jgi:microcystin degradation protein MlrC
MDVTRPEFRVVSGELQHETNTFNRTPTTLSNFEAEYYIVGCNEILRARRGTRSGIGGVIEAAESLYHWNLGMNLVASANPTGTITSQCFKVSQSQ